MKWIILIIIAVVVGVWLYRGRRKNAVEDPEAKTIEEQDFYLSPEEEASRDKNGNKP